MEAVFQRISRPTTDIISLTSKKGRIHERDGGEDLLGSRLGIACDGPERVIGSQQRGPLDALGLVLAVGGAEGPHILAALHLGRGAQ